jgi:hypothetical protein
MSQAEGSPPPSMSRRHKVALVLLSLLALALIFLYWITTPPADQSQKIDSWYRSPPWDFEYHCTKIPKDRFRPVTPESRKMAIQLLQEVSVVELKEEEVELWVGESPMHAPDLRPYLVRAVKLDRPGSVFVISSRDRALWILSGAMGWDSPPIVKAPLVIWLPFKPDVVYTSCAMSV